MLIIMGFFIGENCMKTKTCISVCIALGLGLMLLSGCVEQQTDDLPQRIGVLITIIPQLEMVEFIGGDLVDVTVMVPAGQSPHSFEPAPEQMIKVAQADAYFIVGSGVEFEEVHLNAILEQNPELHIFDCSEDIHILPYNQHYGQEHHDESDHHHEDEHDEDDHQHHAGTDPHIWTSPVLLKQMAEVVYNGLITLDADNQESYYSRYIEYIEKIDTLHQTISDMLAPYEGRSFMVYHPAWGYFGTTYHLKQIAVEDAGKQPGPAGVAALIQQAQQENITVVFVSPQFDTTQAETIATEINGRVVFANPLTSDYETTMLQLAQDIVAGFDQ